MKYSIGLDCGISSVGFAVMELDYNDEPRRIVKLGSRVFDKAENPKDGSSLAQPRREARGTRRRIRRHQYRLQRIRDMLIEEHIISQNELDKLFQGQLSDIYELRTRALDSAVTNIEFARILINLAQRRGFKSNRKVDANDNNSDAGKLLKAVGENHALMQEKGYRTVGEMLYSDEKYANYKRNKGEDYMNTVSRSMIAEEISKIFEAQRKYGNDFASESIEKKYSDIVLYQRPFDLGPDSPSPYAGNQIEKMIGSCTLIPNEKRAAKATYSFQLFSLMQGINSIMLVNNSGEKTSLSNTDKTKIKELCFSKATVNYASIRKALKIPNEYRFNSLSYNSDDIAQVEKKAKFEYLKSYHQIKKVLKDAITTLSIDELDSIGYIFTVYKNDEKIIEELEKTGIDSSLYKLLLNLPSFSKFGHISVKACKKIIPYLEEGMVYSDACAAAGIDFKAHNINSKKMLLPAQSDCLEEVVNPVVKRAVSQTIKVINAIIREMGESPTYLNIELARELSKTKKQRDEIEKQYAKNREANDKIVKELNENFGIIYPTGQDIVKLKLWHEQHETDPYSLKPIEYDRLFSDIGYVDIDHIIPYSISFDDSFNNKILTFSKENRQKSNRIPMQYIPDDKKSEYQVWVNNNIKNYKKRQNLLKSKLSNEDFNGFKSRNLNDTQYLSKLLYNYIKDNLLFSDYSDNNKKEHVMAVNGAITSYMRKRWGITKIREDGDLHHAVDAVVVACVTRSMIKRISNYSKFKEIEYSTDNSFGSVAVNSSTGEVLDVFPFPYADFRKELEIRTESESQYMLHKRLHTLSNYSSEDIEATLPCFVSRMPNHKATGPAHQETVRSGRKKGFVISKVPLQKLKLKNGEIENYYEPDSDTLLYNSIKQRLIEHNGDAEKAFPLDFEFHKPKSNGEPGPIVKKVKIIEKSSLNVIVKNGIANNGSMIRIDVFFVESEGYYFVPIYVSDTVKPTLPNFACIPGNSNWKEMEDKDFIFSLYPNDLIKINAKKDIKFAVNLKGSTLAKEKYCNDVFAYYVGADISTASIIVRTNDNSYIKRGLGIKTLLSIEKYVVDPIGNIRKVNKEKRMYFK